MKYLTPKEIRSSRRMVSRASGQPLPPYTIRTNRGSRRIASRAQVSFPFPLYYFINNFILLQTNYYSITVVSQRLPHKASINFNKEQGGVKVRRWQGKGTGARDALRLEPRYVFSYFFFLFHSSNMLTDTIVP